jgi:hypothetical protein
MLVGMCQTFTHNRTEQSQIAPAAHTTYTSYVNDWLDHGR